MKFRKRKVSRRERILTSVVAGAAVIAFVVYLDIARGDSLEGVLLLILLLVLLGLIFVPLGIWVSNLIYGKPEDW